MLKATGNILAGMQYISIFEHNFSAVDIKHHDTGTKGKFYIEADGREAAQMHYVWAGDKKLIIDHTEVSEAFEGRGLGKQLLRATVMYARANGIKIVPLCPFAKSVFDRTEEYRDVLA